MFSILFDNLIEYHKTKIWIIKLLYFINNYLIKLNLSEAKLIIFIKELKRMFSP